MVYGNDYGNNNPKNDLLIWERIENALLISHKMIRKYVFRYPNNRNLTNLTE